MLIIFDLDDTLIDTTGSIAPRMFKEALQAIYPDFTSADLQMLLHYNTKASSCTQALQNFLKGQRNYKKLLSLGTKIIYSDLPEDLEVMPRIDANKILKELSKHHKLNLVSIGQRDRQLKKMEKAGIDYSLFSKILITENSNKKPLYQQIFNSFDFKASEVIVCGDRVEVDLKPANDLGFITVHMQWGRGSIAANAPWVDYTITKLHELRKIIGVL